MPPITLGFLVCPLFSATVSHVCHRSHREHPLNRLLCSSYLFFCTLTFSFNSCKSLSIYTSVCLWTYIFKTISPNCLFKLFLLSTDPFPRHINYLLFHRKAAVFLQSVPSVSLRSQLSFCCFFCLNGGCIIAGSFSPLWRSLTCVVHGGCGGGLITVFRLHEEVYRCPRCTSAFPPVFRNCFILLTPISLAFFGRIVHWVAQIVTLMSRSP